jgi:hypothetical protein
LLPILDVFDIKLEEGRAVVTQPSVHKLKRDGWPIPVPYFKIAKR